MFYVWKGVTLISDKSKPTSNIRATFHCYFFCRTQRISKAKVHRIWGTCDKVKSTIKDQNTLHIEYVIYKVLHKNKNINVSFTEVSKLQEPFSFKYGI